MGNVAPPRTTITAILSLGGRKDYKSAFGNWIRNNYQVINWAGAGRDGYGDMGAVCG